MPRQARLDAPGIVQHVIIKGIESRQIFDDDRDRRDFITRMGDLSLEVETKVYAWVLMEIMSTSFCEPDPRDWRNICVAY